MATFHVKARTVDMLGRQQIAGIPTAISELFKNAHDAYARNVEVDYFRDDGLFVLRDDGLGMTREDFEKRWLTLGTESKLDGKGGLPPPPKDKEQSQRPILGEKGIGRLAIAIIGQQVFILTRAKRDDRPSDVTVGAYIHWGLFELPGLDLEDILIPVHEFVDGALPDSKSVREMINEVSNSLDKMSESIDQKRLKVIKREMDSFDVDPSVIHTYLKEPSLTGDGCGTHFFIKPADEIIQDDIDSRDAGKASKFERHLLGFTNTMIPGFSSPPIITSFRDHLDEGEPKNLLGESAFFTPEEYKKIDHQFSGNFDKFGQFKGGFGIYQSELENYVLNWNEADGSPTLCGPFSISVAILQNASRDSLVSLEEHSRMVTKLSRHGGLYIYKDGVRIQPYGNSDYDWLDIERRRTMGAGYYYYSFRRMFGVIELSRQDNGKLIEKAGREGFTENKAYRQLRSILMNFFLQTAADYFREDGKYAEVWDETKSELNRNDAIRKKNARQVTRKRGEFEKNLDRFFMSVEAQEPESTAQNTLAEVRQKTDLILRANTELSQKAAALMRIEKEGREVLRELRATMTVTKPRGVGLSRTLTNEWDAYSKQLKKVENEVLSPTEAEIDAFITSSAKNAKLPLTQVARIDAAVQKTTDDAVRTVRRLKKENEEAFAEITKHVQETTKGSLKAVNHAVDEVMAELDRLQRSSSDVKDLFANREELESKIGEVFEREQNQLERLKEQFNALNGFWQEDGYDTVELAEALEEELVSLREQRDADLELAQIGLALNTISHEFEKTVGSLRDGFRRMRSWANANPKLKKLYDDMRYNFDHLDGYLTLFTPLDRRLQRTAIDISGKDIYDFLLGLFDARIERHDIHLQATEAFRQSTIHGFPSSFYPIYVNLIDNAIFWLQRNHNKKRIITLDSEGADFLVIDTGLGVGARDRDNIFQLNFSRKPAGRGMGLYISRESLAKVGYVLTLDPRENDAGATFRISPEST